MRRASPCLVVACLLLSLPGTGQAETFQAKHARVELLSQSSAPGIQLWLGLHFVLEKDWHIYWVNPGDSGQPPVLKWQLPTGFTAGEIQWPMPEKLKHSTLADYGYQDHAVLLVPIHIPGSFKAGTKADIGLQAKWLICREICIADHAELHLALPDQNRSSLIDEARKRLPRPWPRSWRASVASEKDDLVLSIVTGRPIQTAEFYPLTPEQIDNAAAQPVQTNPRGAKIRLRKSDQLLKPISVLKGLLVLGNGEAYEMQAPVTANQAKAHNN